MMDFPSLKTFSPVPFQENPSIIFKFDKAPIHQNQSTVISFSFTLKSRILLQFPHSQAPRDKKDPRRLFMIMLKAETPSCVYSQRAMLINFSLK